MSTLSILILAGVFFWVLSRIGKQIENLSGQIYDIEERMGMHSNYDD